MKKTITYLSAMGLTGLLLLLAPTTSFSAEEVSTEGTKVGVLNCKQVPDSRVNLLIHSTADLKCTFKSTAGGTVERYKGETGVGLGIDLNIKQEENISFAAFSADFKEGTNQLAGKYVGVEASVAAGVGVGAKALVGGNKRTISLQPALSSSEGAGVAAGFSYLYLEPDQ